MRTVTIPELQPLLQSRQHLRDDGWSERAIDTAVAGGTILPVRRGWFVDPSVHADLWPEARHLAHVLAVTNDLRGDGVVSHESAGVAFGLPLYRHRFGRVHLTTASPSRISSGPDVFRHVAPLGETDIVERDGIRVTSLARTVFDMTRTLRREAAVAAADAAERLVALPGREWDEDAAARWRAEMNARVEAATGARGIRQARWVADFADGRAQLPGESVSRLQIVRLGFRTPRVQVPVPGPNGRTFIVDLALDDVDGFGEFDGKGKYLDEAMRRGLSLEQILLEEKQREDWIRGTTQRRFARWSDEHIGTPAALAARLASFHIHPPR